MEITLLHNHLIDPDVLVHHEHPRSTMVPKMLCRRRVDLLSKEHSPTNGEKTGLITRVVTCMRTKTTGLILMNILPPDCLEIQVVKIDSLALPEQVPELPAPADLDEVDVILRDSEFNGQIRIGCARCTNGTHAPMFAEQWAVSDLYGGGRRDVEVLMRCPRCNGAAVLLFAAIMDVGTGVCDHTRKPHRCLAPGAGPLATPR